MSLVDFVNKKVNDVWIKWLYDLGLVTIFHLSNIEKEALAKLLILHNISDNWNELYLSIENGDFVSKCIIELQKASFTQLIAIFYSHPKLHPMAFNLFIYMNQSLNETEFFPRVVFENPGQNQILINPLDNSVNGINIEENFVVSPLGQNGL